MRLFTAMGQPKVSLWGQAPASSCRPVNTRVSVMSVCFPSVLVLLPGKSLTWGYTFKRVQGVEISQHMKRSFHMCCVLWASTHPTLLPPVNEHEWGHGTMTEKVKLTQILDYWQSKQEAVLPKTWACHNWNPCVYVHFQKLQSTPFSTFEIIIIKMKERE